MTFSENSIITDSNNNNNNNNNNNDNILVEDNDPFEKTDVNEVLDDNKISVQINQSCDN